MSDTTGFRFDLIEEPWIPGETFSGERVELGIRATLHRAHELTALHDESPLATAVLHRMLLVILDRSFSPKTLEDWLGLWHAERLPAAPIDSYLGHWRERLDLFSSERPFMQVARLEERITQDKGKAPERTPMWRMVMETSQCGGHINVFEPMPTDALLAPPAAARALLVFHAYTNGGRIQNEAESWKGGLLRAGAVALLRGATLRETLLLNTVARPERAQVDVPPWERDRDIERVVRGAVGPIDMLVWPSRRVQLLPTTKDGRTVLAEVVTAAGERWEHETPDPQMAYFVRNPKNPPVALRFDPDRSPWRDSTALFDATRSVVGVQRPAAIDQLARLVQEGELSKSHRQAIDLLGMSTDKAVIRLWRAERMPVPPRLLLDANALAAFKRALELAELVGVDLDRKALFLLCGTALAPGGRDAHSTDIQALKESLAAMPDYWGELGREFEPWLLALEHAADPDDALPEWKSTIRRAALRAFRAAVSRLGTRARAFQAEALAEGTLRRALAEHLADTALPPTDGGSEATEGVPA